MKHISEILKDQKYPEAFKKRHGKKSKKEFKKWLNK